MIAVRLLKRDELMNEGEREVAKEERRKAEEKRDCRRCHRWLPPYIYWSGTNLMLIQLKPVLPLVGD